MAIILGTFIYAFGSDASTNSPGMTMEERRLKIRSSELRTEMDRLSARLSDISVGLRSCKTMSLIPSLIEAFSFFWSVTTNSFHVSLGMMSPILLDVALLTGIPPRGTPAYTG